MQDYTNTVATACYCLQASHTVQVLYNPVTSAYRSYALGTGLGGATREDALALALPAGESSYITVVAYDAYGNRQTDAAPGFSFNSGVCMLCVGGGWGWGGGRI